MNFNFSLDSVANSAIDFVVVHGDPVLGAIAFVVQLFIGTFSAGLSALPAWAMIVLVTALAVWRKGVQFAVFTLLSLLLLLGMELWEETISTLALVLGSSSLSVIFGIP